MPKKLNKGFVRVIIEDSIKNHRTIYEIQNNEVYYERKWVRIAENRFK